MDFLPSGPVTVTSMIVVFTLAPLCFAFLAGYQKLIGAAILVSWIAARLATTLENPLILVSGLAIAAFLASFPKDGASKSVTWLYGARIVLSSLLVFGVVSWWWLWEINRVFLWFQYIIITGTLIDGTFANGKIAENVNRILQFKAKPSQDFHK